ncbi:MAG: hypothetical protein PHR00_03760 [Patescibacteria group bacterium]|nr:hypothetical protein [Patescibacteria group bacterium]
MKKLVEQFVGGCIYSVYPYQDMGDDISLKEMISYKEYDNIDKRAFSLLNKIVIPERRSDFYVIDLTNRSGGTDLVDLAQVKSEIEKIGLYAAGTFDLLRFSKQYSNLPKPYNFFALGEKGFSDFMFYLEVEERRRSLGVACALSIFLLRANSRFLAIDR